MGAAGIHLPCFFTISPSYSSVWHFSASWTFQCDLNWGVDRGTGRRIPGASPDVTARLCHAGERRGWGALGKCDSGHLPSDARLLLEVIQQEMSTAAGRRRVLLTGEPAPAVRAARAPCPTQPQPRPPHAPGPSPAAPLPEWVMSLGSPLASQAAGHAKFRDAFIMVKKCGK